MSHFQGLTLEESNMLGIMTVFGKDDMDSLIVLTDENSKATFARLHRAMEFPNATNVLYSSVTQEQQAIWEAIASRQAEIVDSGYGPTFVAAAQLILNAWPPYPKPGCEKPLPPGSMNEDQKRRFKCTTLFKYALRVNEMINQADDMTTHYCDTHAVAAMYGNISWYYYEASNHEEAVVFADRALQVCANAFPNPLPSEETRSVLGLRADLEGVRAVIAYELGDEKTAMLFGQRQFVNHTALAASTTGQNTVELANACLMFGRILILKNNYPEATAHLERAAKILKALPGFHRIQLWAYYHSHGYIYFLNGELPQAEGCFLRALQDREAAFGKDDLEGLQTGELLYALGSVCAQQGRLDDSFWYLTRARMQMEKTAGTVMHWGVAKVGYKLAGHYMRTQDYISTSKLLHQALQFYETAPHHTGLRARVQYRLAHLYMAQGLDVEAQDAMNKAWQLRCQLVPQDGRGAWELSDQDYDALIVFSAR